MSVVGISAVIVIIAVITSQCYIQDEPLYHVVLCPIRKFIYHHSVILLLPLLLSKPAFMSFYYYQQYYQSTTIYSAKYDVTVKPLHTENSLDIRNYTTIYCCCHCLGCPMSCCCVLVGESYSQSCENISFDSTSKHLKNIQTPRPPVFNAFNNFSFFQFIVIILFVIGFSYPFFAFLFISLCTHLYRCHDTHIYFLYFVAKQTQISRYRVYTIT